MQVSPYSIEQEFVTCSTPPALHGAVRRNPPVIVAASQHHPRKGIEVLLHALADLKRAGVPYAARLLSGGVLIDQHRSLLHSLELEDRVQILGRVAPYFASADVFVLPSREEQATLALVEAMGAGLACVASGCDGIPEDISHGKDALMTVPGDAASLAEAIATLIADADLRAALGRAARATFSGSFRRRALRAPWRGRRPQSRAATGCRVTLRQQSRLPPADAEAYLVWARRGNTGDVLIADACEQFLRDRGLNVWRSDGSLEDAAEAGDSGYLGDLFAGFGGC